MLSQQEELTNGFCFLWTCFLFKRSGRTDRKRKWKQRVQHTSQSRKTVTQLNNINKLLSVN